ncbi:unnamed protein product [Protopolystoma xenopodis]|uniref:Uncharacterized protein n=1 Tax=Protopolystoma xenopodis TaxID=117903 RepID=A0A448XPJ3_9PLAT|nr:unnamed protein product [Protopolystoma xenopodis]
MFDKNPSSPPQMRANYDKPQRLDEVRVKLGRLSAWLSGHPRRAGIAPSLNAKHRPITEKWGRLTPRAPSHQKRVYLLSTS